MKEPISDYRAWLQVAIEKAIESEKYDALISLIGEYKKSEPTPRAELESLQLKVILLENQMTNLLLALKASGAYRSLELRGAPRQG